MFLVAGISVKAGFISLGCSKNLVDTEVMLGILQQHGIELTANPAEADILIVNTCAFIQSAKEESITTILNMAEYKESGRCRSLIVAGCLGQRYKQELLDEIPEADAIIGTGAWGRIMEAVEETLKGHRLVIAGKDEALYDEHTPRITTTPSYTAYVKIAEGCNNRCAFCAIPYIRGDYRSRRIEDICDEIRHLTENGVREVVLIAQDSTEYGRDLYGQPKLAKLLREIVKVPKLKWVRTLYSYPKYFSDELIETIASEPKICKYVDLPLQHAHDAVLRSMRRPDTQEEMRALIHKLRERIPGVTIRSTFIVGFPGETDAQYQTLRNFLEEMRLHVLARRGHAGLRYAEPGAGGDHAGALSRPHEPAVQDLRGDQPVARRQGTRCPHRGSRRGAAEHLGRPLLPRGARGRWPGLRRERCGQQAGRHRARARPAGLHLRRRRRAH